MFLWKNLAPACAKTIEAMMIVLGGMAENLQEGFKLTWSVAKALTVNGGHPIESGGRDQDSTYNLVTRSASDGPGRGVRTDGWVIILIIVYKRNAIEDCPFTKMSLRKPSLVKQWLGRYRSDE